MGSVGPSSARRLQRPSTGLLRPFTTPRCPVPRVILPGPGRKHLSTENAYPDPEEERGVTHEAYMQAIDHSKPKGRIEGLQEFAAAIWERRRRIPSTTYNDPLSHLFDEFDLDSDGRLTAAEVAAALQGRNVKITEKLAQEYIDEVDTNNNGTVERDEWEKLIFHMASVDLHRGSTTSVSSVDHADALQQPDGGEP